MNKATRQYLQRHAEPEAALVDPLSVSDTHRAAVVLPAAGEGELVLQALAAIRPDHGALAVVVVNGREDAAPTVHDANRRTLAALHAEFPPAETSGVLTRHQAPWGDLVIVDRASEPSRRLAPNEGVGHARKIGTDVVLRLHAHGRLRTDFVHSTDADAQLPADAFEQTSGLSSDRVAAALLPFRHRPSPDTPEIRAASAAYEIKLRYQVLGLRWAGSPYAFHTIGSTIVVGLPAYARVRGFPKRVAAEDFYLLDKLAKVGRIVSLKGDPVQVLGRVSDRVPFGTGRALMELTRDPQAAVTLYDPRCYAYLRALMRAFEDASQEADLPEAITARCGDLDPAPLLDALQPRLQKMIDAYETAPDPTRRLRALHTQFDSIRTLKLIHHLRDHGWPALSLRDGLRQAPFVGPQDPDDDLDEVRQRLAELERHAPDAPGRGPWRSQP